MNIPSLPGKHHRPESRFMKALRTNPEARVGLGMACAFMAVVVMVFNGTIVL